MQDLPTVAVWKNGWLPRSETFIVDQLDNFVRWNPVKLGFFNIDDGLTSADFAPYSTHALSKVLRFSLGTRYYRSKYEDFLRENRADLIHAHFGSGGVNSMNLARDLNIPAVTTFHGQDAVSYGSRFRAVERSYRRALEVLFSRSKTLLPVSRFVADNLIQSGAPARKVRVHYTGTVITDLCPATDREGILFVGRLVEKKGVADLLQAASILPRRLRATPISIVGEGPLDSDLKRLAVSKGLNVRFLGWQTPLEIRKLMSSHSVFCGPSRATSRDKAEGFGMVYIEAALQELPVVAYSAGGTREAVSHGTSGLLAIEGDVRGLSAYLEDLLVAPAAASTLGRNARLRAIQDFDIGVQTRRLESIFDDAVGC